MPIWVVVALTGAVILGMFAWFEVQVYEIRTSIAAKAETIAPTPPGSLSARHGCAHRTRRLLFSRVTVVAIGVIAIGVLVWFAGPLLRIGGEAPLASTPARVATIAMLVLLIVGLELFRYWRARRLNRRIIESLTRSQSPAAMVDGATDSELEYLRQRFEDAMAELRKVSPSGQDLYDLPWYLVVGPPGSGKTTLLRNSGLRFPLAERLGVEVIAGVGGTRSCDWWLTDQRSCWIPRGDLRLTTSTRRPMSPRGVAFSTSSSRAAPDSQSTASSSPSAWPISWFRTNRSESTPPARSRPVSRR